MSKERKARERQLKAVVKKTTKAMAAAEKKRDQLWEEHQRACSEVKERHVELQAAEEALLEHQVVPVAVSLTDAQQARMMEEGSERDQYDDINKTLARRRLLKVQGSGRGWHIARYRLTRKGKAVKRVLLAMRGEA